MIYDSRDSGLARQKWFKPAVSGWFALLLGGGTLAIWLITPPFKRDAFMANTGLAGLHRYFEAPVGNAGMLAIVGVAALVGLLLGAFVGGRVAASSNDTLPFTPAVETVDDSNWSDDAIFGARETPEPGRRRLFSTREDIDELGIGEPASPDNPRPAKSPDLSEAGANAADQSAPAAPLPRSSADEQATAVPGPSQGDLTLEQLTNRLKQVIGERAERPGAAEGQDDPVIAFLRREAARAPAVDPATEESEGRDSQAMLRGALDRLDRLGQSG